MGQNMTPILALLNNYLIIWKISLLITQLLNKLLISIHYSNLLNFNLIVFHLSNHKKCSSNKYFKYKYIYRESLRKWKRGQTRTSGKLEYPRSSHCSAQNILLKFLIQCATFKLRTKFLAQFYTCIPVKY